MFRKLVFVTCLVPVALGSIAGCPGRPATAVEGATESDIEEYRRMYAESEAEENAMGQD
ncbi:MAG: hypothetical protein AAGD07_10245 [Planctomycetota bacterium]